LKHFPGNCKKNQELRQTQKRKRILET